MSAASLLARRERLLGPGNPLFYDEPVHLVRGEGVWVYDADGRRYLDCYNNVPSVGHCHPRVVEAICEQTRTLNTHTRYLHENILNYAEQLLATFGEGLDSLLLACTGSEANEVALRMARVSTGNQGLICTDATYHGNTALVSQLSTLFEPPEGYGAAVRHVPWPDRYRTPEGIDDDAALAAHYAHAVQNAVDAFAEEGIGTAALLVCPIFANEGLPRHLPGYLAAAAQIVRDAGGILIADEVQAGFGRTGHLWGHAPDNVTPDIVTLGKPMGNGYPVSGLVTSEARMADYRQRVMYFNTYGGNPVACAAAQAVLDVLREEELVHNAAEMGAYLQTGLERLAAQHAVVGDVRTRGLFVGVELVEDRATKVPATAAAKRVVNALRRDGVLISKIGAHDNVLKMRPPLCIQREHADLLLATLDRGLSLS